MENRNAQITIVKELIKKIDKELENIDRQTDFFIARGKMKSVEYIRLEAQFKSLMEKRIKLVDTYDID